MALTLVVTLLAACTTVPATPAATDVPSATAARTASATPTAAARTDAPAPSTTPEPFAVVRSSPGLDGTILVALRGLTGPGAPEYQGRIVELDRSGAVVWQYLVPAGMSVTDVRRLPNGNVLFARFAAAGSATPLTASTPKAAVEVARDGTIAREMAAPTTSHAEILPNGNLLTADVTSDQVTEYDPSGRVVWVWRASDHIKAFDATTYANWDKSLAINNVYADRGTQTYWTHVNSVQRLANGDTLMSLRNLDLVIAVDREGRVTRSFGPLMFKHQHCAFELPNGNYLVTDNGNSRVIEIEPATFRVVWSYSTGLNIPIGGCAQRLPSGNTLITDSGARRVVEVSPAGDIVWDLHINVPGTNWLYRAVWSR